jgi:toxin ParE1/3/4
MRLVWSELALVQLQEAREFVAQDNPDAADRLVATIRAAAARLGEFPLLGQALPAGRRACVVPRTPFRLIYRIVDDDLLLIVSVWHGARRWPFNAA